MNNNEKRPQYGSLSIGFVLVAIAVAILIAWMIGDWVLFIPAILIECGGYGVVLGAVAGRNAKPGESSRSVSAYYIFWGSLLLILGLLWVINDQYPGNLPAIGAAFLIWLAIMVIAVARR
jgi:hypothetical protein